MSLTGTVGSTLVWGLKTYDANGTLANVGTGPTALVYLPDQTTTAGNIATVTTGTYTASVTATLAGRYRVVWSGSGANSGGLPFVEVADIWPTDPRLIISLAEARAALDVPTATLTNDDELRGYIAAATVVIENIVGTVLARTITETRSGDGRPFLQLNQYPTAITSVTENGTTLAAGTYCFDEAGLLWKGSRPNAGTWSTASPRNVVVTYTAGGTTVADNIIKAASNLVRHWWNQGLQQGYYVAGEPDVTTGSTTIAGYAVPNFVVDMLKPSMAAKVPGIA